MKTLKTTFWAILLLIPLSCLSQTDKTSFLFLSSIYERTPPYKDKEYPAHRLEARLFLFLDDKEFHVEDIESNSTTGIDSLVYVYPNKIVFFSTQNKKEPRVIIKKNGWIHVNYTHYKQDPHVKDFNCIDSVQYAGKLDKYKIDNILKGLRNDKSYIIEYKE